MAAAKYDIQTETGAGLSLALVYKDQNDAKPKHVFLSVLNIWTG